MALHAAQGSLRCLYPLSALPESANLFMSTQIMTLQTANFSTLCPSILLIGATARKRDPIILFRCVSHWRARRPISFFDHEKELILGGRDSNRTRRPMLFWSFWSLGGFDKSSSITWTLLLGYSRVWSDSASAEGIVAKQLRLSRIVLSVDFNHPLTLCINLLFTVYHHRIKKMKPSHVLLWSR